MNVREQFEGFVPDQLYALFRAEERALIKRSVASLLHRS
jgi:hypothetical protein